MLTFVGLYADGTLSKGFLSKSLSSTSSASPQPASLVMFFGFGLAGATGFPVDLGTNEGFEAELDLATTGFEVGLGAAGDGFLSPEV